MCRIVGEVLTQLNVFYIFRPSFVILSDRQIIFFLDFRFVFQLHT